MRLFSLVAGLGLLAAACGGSSSASPPPDTPPSLLPGGVGLGQVEIDGTTIDYVVSVPSDFSPGDEAPLLLAFPPGGQDLSLTSSVMESVYASEANRLGWVVISPAAPGGVLFFNGSEDLVPGLLDWTETWVNPEGGAPHVAGISNGGISSFRYGAENPDRVLSMVTFPGFPRGGDADALEDLSDIPIRFFVGGQDTTWLAAGEAARDTLLGFGADVSLTSFPGEGHVISSTSDGAIVFGELERFRRS